MRKTRSATTSKQRAAKQSGRTKKGAKTVRVLQLASCPSSRKARAFLKKRGFDIDVRDLRKNKLSAAELEKLIGRRDHEDFLNTRSKTFQKEGMGEKPPARRKAISWMVKDPGLIRRPIVLAGGRVIVGFDREGMARL